MGATVIALVTACLALPAPGEGATRNDRSRRSSSAPAPKVYRWIDENGHVHYGDQIPPEYAGTDREVLNPQGVKVDTQQGVKSEAEIAAEARAEAERAAVLAAVRRDEVLLSTYLSIEEIEALRDRRVELIKGQISITQNYLSNLNDKLQQLKQEASAYKPYSADPAAQTIDPQLAQELTDTMDSIALYERTLKDTRARQAQLVAQFDADIARFRELKGL